MQQEVDHEDQTQDLLESESSPREGDDASAKPAAPGLSRRQKMSAARLERRRAVDRESQRATRARTKAYITQLENNIAVMEQNATNGHTSTLVRQVQQKQEEIDRLNGLVTNVRKLLNATIGNNGDKTSSDDLPNTQIAPVRKNSEASAARPWLGAYDSPSETSSPDDSMALCPFSVALKCGEGPKNYFRNLNTAVEFIQANGRSTVFAGEDDAVDDDIAIRAVLHGWRAVEEKHDLDLAWQFVRAVDQGSYSRCEPVPRLANIRTIRATLMQKLCGNSTNRRKRAGYMTPTETQKTVKHPAIVDFFVWPQVRNYLIDSRTTFVSEVEAGAFATSLRFHWPYELRDVCRRHRESGLYSYSESFDRSFSDLASWTIAPEFYGISSMSPMVLQPNCPIMQQIEAHRQLRANRETGIVLPTSDQQQPPEGTGSDILWSSSVVRLDTNRDRECRVTDYHDPVAYISSEWPELSSIMEDNHGWIP